jgi:hypothetical protein
VCLGPAVCSPPGTSSGSPLPGSSPGITGVRLIGQHPGLLPWPLPLLPMSSLVAAHSGSLRLSPDLGRGLACPHGTRPWGQPQPLCRHLLGISSLGEDTEQRVRGVEAVLSQFWPSLAEWLWRASTPKRTVAEACTQYGREVGTGKDD